MRVRVIALGLLLLCPALSLAGDGNRLTYLDESDPYYVHRDFPKLITPQWVGEEGVEVVVVLAIDDMRDNIPKYEAFLRPILDRLKRVDGRAALSIMTIHVDPADPQLQAWIKEGVSIEVHTLTHPCPLLQKSDFAAAQKTYHDCIDLLHKIPNNRPVAFRMPCCDSLNTPSPRFFAEIFNGASDEGHFLTIDSSVFNILTPDDPSLPRNLVQDPDGRERFRKYLPFPSFVNTIENYPYPYLIGRLCWEFPCVVPSDWEGNNLHRPNNPKTVEDLKAALDAIVLKQGVFNLVFHPHGWIKSEQVVELIDHAVAKHGKKVKFLNFREAQERLDKNLLGGQPVRSNVSPGSPAIFTKMGLNPFGRDNGVRLIDLNNDGYLDVVVANPDRQETQLWDVAHRNWKTLSFPSKLVSLLVDGFLQCHHEHFGILSDDGFASFLVNYGQDKEKTINGGWRFTTDCWKENPLLLKLPDEPVVTSLTGEDEGIRLRDVDGDGRCELIHSNQREQAIFRFQEGIGWTKMPFALPAKARVVFDAWGDDPNRPMAPAQVIGRDGGLRFVDLDEDGHDDVIFATDKIVGAYLFDSTKTGWSRPLIPAQAAAPGTLPPIVRRGGPTNVTSNGFWAHSRSLWWQNEDTAKLPDLVDRRSFNDLLKDVEPRSKSPEASRKSIRIRPGFQVELVAQESLVEDPIAFDWSADGRLWVVEMGDYPLGTDGKGKPGGVVRVLQDTNGDGRYDRSTTFLDGLPFPTGLLAWRKGVLVACAPDILYAEDRDGDGKADVKEVLFTGFKEGNQQHRLNGFDFGLDGWVYGANGDSGGQIKSIKTGETVSIQGRDFRFQPDTGRLEPASGGTQYGRHRDDYGHWFGNNNSFWAWQYVLTESDLKRNPKFAAPDTKQMLEADRRLYPISRTLTRFNDLDNANRVTSANSTTPYRDELFGPAFENNLFISEPVHNMVHRMVLEPVGSTFRGHRFVDEASREFLASSDNWFRPTMLKTGPDGALWVADMYRAVIEHPEWIPDDWEARIDLRAGHDQGRLYRVFPVGQKPRPIPNLARLDAQGLVAALDSPSGWQRDSCQRLLFEAHDPSAIEPLKALVRTCTRPKTRVQALWTLQGLNGLDEATVLAALADSHLEVRRHAIGTGRSLLDAQPSVGVAMAKLADDPEASVRFELALALGDWSDPKAGQALARIVRRDPEDSWLCAAVLSSALPHAGGILSALFAEGDTDSVPAAYVEPLFAIAGSQPAQVAHLINLVATPKDGRFAVWQFTAGVGLLDAAQRSGTSFEKLSQQDLALREALDKLPGLFDFAMDRGLDPQATETVRLAALRLVGRKASLTKPQQQGIVGLLTPKVPTDIQLAAIEALGRVEGPGPLARLLVDQWKGSSPAVRTGMLDALLSRGDGPALLLETLEAGSIPPGEIHAAHRRRLLDHRTADIRKRSATLFASTAGGREPVIASYRKALRPDGDATHGAEVFKRVCAVCHRVGNVGTEVGADLASLTDKSPEALLTAILDPNRAFEAKFTNFTVQTTDGRVLTGMIAAETGNSVTLRRQEGKEDVLLRSDIEAMVGSGQSLMPEGLEKDLSPQDVADLIALLAATGPARKEVAGNRPETVRADADGKVSLKAAQAEIYGDSLTFEPRYGNLGFWSARNDRALWTFTTEQPGKFALWLDWACAEGSQGNGYVITVDETNIEGKVTDTGTWDEYRTAQVGEVALEPGRHRLEVKAVDRVKGALMDLRTIELRPVGKNAPVPCCGQEP
ncbi:MAG TPA: PVC-type heme-binding CxxCH protein [Isosphaeraceae bacterium]|nr:PVC-type heme-binding CxxCH protein [Isosphaeraceae bacterium]